MDTEPMTAGFATPAGTVFVEQYGGPAVGPHGGERRSEVNPNVVAPEHERKPKPRVAIKKKTPSRPRPLKAAAKK